MARGFQLIDARLRHIERAWPALLPAGFAVAHVLFTYRFPEHSATLNRFVALVFQIVGGGFVLWSIDSTLGVARGGSIRGMVMSWIRTWPRRGAGVTVTPAPATMAVTGLPPTIRIGIGGNSIEDRVKRLEQEIVWIKEDQANETKRINAAIEQSDRRFQRGLSSIRSDLGLLDSNSE